MLHKLYSKINIVRLIIFISLLMSIIVSKYNLINYDKFFLNNSGEEQNHIMIKYDAYRYLSHGAEIKSDLENGKKFFETGREHFTKYLPPRLAAAYYHFFDIDLFNNFKDKKINLGIHFPYLLIQCLIYYLSLFFLYTVISKRIDQKICLPIIENKAMSFKLWMPHEKLHYSKLKFYSPSSNSQTITPNIIVTPALAVDQEGNRIGYGKGYYDKYYKNNKSLMYIGYVYKEQILKKLPFDKHDLKLNAIVSDNFLKIIDKKIL